MTKAAVNISQLYRMMNSIENNVGGGEGIEGLYGSITGANMERILQCMEKTTGLCGTNQSVLMDVGSGLCRPLLHAMATNRATSCVGVEVDSVKCLKAEAFCSQIQKRMRTKEMMAGSDWNIDIVCTGIESLETLGPVTHVYTFWEGVPVDARAGLGRLFRESSTTTTISVVQRAIRCENPAEFLDEAYGFGPLTLVDSFRVSMSGSGRSFMAYIFVKRESNMIKAMFQNEDMRRISVNKRQSSEEDSSGLQQMKKKKKKKMY